MKKRKISLLLAVTLACSQATGFAVPVAAQEIILDEVIDIPEKNAENREAESEAETTQNSLADSIGLLSVEEVLTGEVPEEALYPDVLTDLNTTEPVSELEIETEINTEKRYEIEMADIDPYLPMGASVTVSPELFSYSEENEWAGKASVDAVLYRWKTDNSDGVTITAADGTEIDCTAEENLPVEKMPCILTRNDADEIQLCLQAGTEDENGAWSVLCEKKIALNKAAQLEETGEEEENTGAEEAAETEETAETEEATETEEIWETETEECATERETAAETEDVTETEDITETGLTDEGIEPEERVTESEAELIEETGEAEEKSTETETQEEEAIKPQMARSTEAKKLKCGDNLTWKFDSATGTLTIDGSGEMYDFETDGLGHTCPWRNLCHKIKKVVIADDVTYISQIAFQYCSNLTSVTFPKKLKCIGQAAFLSCTALTTIDLPDDLERISIYAFYKCTGLSALDLPEKTICVDDWAFSGCTNLKSIKLC